MLREMTRDASIHKIILDDEALWEPFVEFVTFDEFTVASDAFDTLKGILTKHPKMTGEWLRDHRESFLRSYNRLILKGTELFLQPVFFLVAFDFSIHSRV
jgi:hypothetical protein